MGLSDSQFHMWRALFALAHADHVVTKEEIRFMVEAMEDVPFSGAQRATLTDDLARPANIEDMFLSISEAKDQAEFFKYAHALVHIDGDYAPEEQRVMLKLKELHLKSTDVDSLVGQVDLEFESEGEAIKRVQGEPYFKTTMMSFRDRFLGNRFRD